MFYLEIRITDNHLLILSNYNNHQLELLPHPLAAAISNIKYYICLLKIYKKIFLYQYLVLNSTGI